jgi:hypothetical protein
MEHRLAEEAAEALPIPVAAAVAPKGAAVAPNSGGGRRPPRVRVGDARANACRGNRHTPA